MALPMRVEAPKGCQLQSTTEKWKKRPRKCKNYYREMPNADMKIHVGVKGREKATGR